MNLYYNFFFNYFFCLQSSIFDLILFLNGLNLMIIVAYLNGQAPLPFFDYKIILIDYNYINISHFYLAVLRLFRSQ